MAAKVSLSKLPPQVKQYLEMAKPAFAAAHQAIMTCEPYAMQAYELGVKGWEAAQPYHPEELAPALAGLVMLFCGGSFFTLIAAVEAFRLIGYQSTLEAVTALYESYKAAREASKKDDTLDEDGDGVADVKQISADQLALRKMALLAKTVDPAKVETALQAIATGLFAVVATLRAKFAKAVTLGITLSGKTEDALMKFAKPALEEAVQSEYQKWIAPGIRTFSTMLGVFLAWFLQRIISTFHCSVRGAELFVSGALSYAVRHKYVEPIETDTPKYTMIVGGLAVFGFVTQLSTGFALMFPLNILLLPFRIVEWLLVYFVASP